MSDVNRKRKEIQGVIHRYELFIGQQPSAFDGVDIGQYLNFDSPSEEVEEGNKEVVDQIISIIKKKK